MNAQQIVNMFADHGVSLEVEGNRLRFYPKGKVNQFQIGLLRKHKQQLVLLLAGEKPKREVDWPETIDVREVTPCMSCDSLELWESMTGIWRCSHCDPPTR